MNKEFVKTWLKYIKTYENIASMLLGFVVVVFVGGGLFFTVAKLRPTLPTLEKSDNEDVQEQDIQTEEKDEKIENTIVAKLPESIEYIDKDGVEYVQGLPVKYKVQSNDSTWSIAKAFYGYGFNYVDIENANELKPNADVTEGMVLVIPDVPVKNPNKPAKEVSVQPSETPQLTSQSEKESESSNQDNKEYTVKKGEGLYQIAQQELGNGNRYTEIYELNKDKMRSPEDIEAGMVLQMPE